MINVTFHNISVIKWRSVLLMEEAGVPDKLYHIILYRVLLEDMSKKYIMTTHNHTQMLFFCWILESNQQRTYAVACKAHISSIIFSK